MSFRDAITAVVRCDTLRSWLFLASEVSRFLGGGVTGRRGYNLEAMMTREFDGATSG